MTSEWWIFHSLLCHRLGLPDGTVCPAMLPGYKTGAAPIKHPRNSCVEMGIPGLSSWWWDSALQTRAPGLRSFGAPARWDELLFFKDGVFTRSNRLHLGSLWILQFLLFDNALFLYWLKSYWNWFWQVQFTASQGEYSGVHYNIFFFLNSVLRAGQATKQMFISSSALQWRHAEVLQQQATALHE